MKKLFVLFFASIALSCFAAPPQTVNVTSNSTAIIPKRIQAAPAWNTNTVYAQGAYIEGQSGQFYMALAGGTSSTNSADKPGWARGSSTEGTVTWYRVEKGDRLGYSVYNAGTNAVWVSVGSPAEAQKGIHVAAGAGNDTKGIPQGILNLQVNAILDYNLTNVVTFQEW